MAQRKPGESLLDVAKGPFDPEKVEGMKAVYRVIAVFFFALAFWAASLGPWPAGMGVVC